VATNPSGGPTPTTEATGPAVQPGTPAADCGKSDNPVAVRLASAFGVPTSEIMGWHCQGFGFGEIAKAYLLAKSGKMSVADIFALKKGGKGWGNIIKDAGVNHSSLSMGRLLKASKLSSTEE